MKNQKHATQIWKRIQKKTKNGKYYWTEWINDSNTKFIHESNIQETQMLKKNSQAKREWMMEKKYEPKWKRETIEEPALSKIHFSWMYTNTSKSCSAPFYTRFSQYHRSMCVILSTTFPLKKKRNKWIHCSWYLQWSLVL